LGFLDVEQSPHLYRAEHLFNEPAALIVGAPWLGKTTTARQLHSWLVRQPDGLAFGEHICLTEFGRYGDERTVPPPWWETWRHVSPPAPACWIVDALDEGEERLRRMREAIVSAVANL
jgi:hypothetical protein